jgi:hypothetical protein
LKQQLLLWRLALGNERKLGCIGFVLKDATVDLQNSVVAAAAVASSLQFVKGKLNFE